MTSACLLLLHLPNSSLFNVVWFVYCGNCGGS
uniref:Uncharacterized protein n=1 Tax=Arundo donax TaxID=35708 RepID=A0A0A9C9K1_ARUDO